MDEKRNARARKESATRGSISHNRPSSRRRKRRRQNKVVLILLLLLLIVGAIGAALVWKRYGPSKEKADLKSYFGIVDDEQLALVVDNEVQAPAGRMLDGESYIEYSVVRDMISSRFYWDKNENILLYTLPTDMVTVPVDSKAYTISEEKQTKDYVIFKTEGDTAYLALDFISEYVNISYKEYKEPQRIVMQTQWGETEVAETKKDTQIRYRAGVKSPILSEVKKTSKVRFIEQEGDWRKVCTEDGFIGYVQNTALNKATKEKITNKFDGVKDEDYTSITKPYTISLGWHQVTSQAANKSVQDTLAKTKGLTTISPTWFSVADNEGNISSIASREYVDYAHQNNIEVWGLVDNFKENIDSLQLLSTTSKRTNLVKQLVAAALENKLDGINLDFENISEETGEHYVQFIREMSIKCRQNNLVLSVDNYVPRGYTAHYNREEQGKLVDYIIIMGYDEHYSGSLESGSVASIGFVKDGIEQTLKEVPASKVINAVPFYTRLWKEVPKTQEQLDSDKGTEKADYDTKVSSEAIGMAEAEKRLSEAGVEANWDETTMQNYATWQADGATYKVWLEDSKSMEARLQLMQENKLAGTAAWKLGFEKAEIWDTISEYVKQN